MNDNANPSRLDNTPNQSLAIDGVMHQLMILVQKTQDTDSLVQTNREMYQNFVIHLQTRSRIATNVQYAERSQCSGPDPSLEKSRRELQMVDEVLRKKAGELNNLRRRLVRAQCDIFDRLLQIQNKILYVYLPRWHQEQQLTNNGIKSETIKLDSIQAWFEKIVDIIWRIKNQIKGLQITLTEKPNVPFDTDELDFFVTSINKALETLILNAFVVEKQPPQVMKTNTRFTSTVRFLCGNKLNTHMITPTVKALILSEPHARTVIKYHHQLIENSWSTIDNQYIAQHGHYPNPQSQDDTITTPSIGQQMSDTRQAFCTGGSLHSLSPTNPPHGMTIDQQQQQMTYRSAHLNQLDASHDQQLTMTPVDQQRLQSQHQVFQQIQHQSQQQSVATPPPAVSMTTHPHHIQRQQQLQQIGGINEIGYNPSVAVRSKDFESNGEILNNSNILEFQESTGHMICHFRNMQLKKIKRTEKRGSESVMDEKFVLLFFTEFRVADDSFLPQKSSMSPRIKRGDMLFHLLALSLPVVVIVHGNQEPHAWATVTWHNAFAIPDELLYTVPDRVTWRDLGHVLSEKFRSITGRGLSQQNLQYLAEKVYRNRVSSDDVLISWNQFSKEPLADTTFTFWEWIHSILKLVREHLRELWRDERIWGFIGKRGCVELLLSPTHEEPALVGTFLLRFSESELGGVTIAWVSDSAELAAQNPSLNDKVQISRLSPSDPNSVNVVMHLQPMMGSDLRTRSLADRIRDLNDLVYLFPNIPKDDAFADYYSPIVSLNSSSYIRSILVTTIAANYPKTIQLNQSNKSPRSQHSSNHELTSNSNTTHASGSQCSPDNYYPENIPMNDIMESDYQTFDPIAGDFDYTIQ